MSEELLQLRIIRWTVNSISLPCIQKKVQSIIYKDVWILFTVRCRVVISKWNMEDESFLKMLNFSIKCLAGRRRPRWGLRVGETAFSPVPGNFYHLIPQLFRPRGFAPNYEVKSVLHLQNYVIKHYIICLIRGSRPVKKSLLCFPF